MFECFFWVNFNSRFILCKIFLSLSHIFHRKPLRVVLMRMQVKILHRLHLFPYFTLSTFLSDVNYPRLYKKSINKKYARLCWDMYAAAKAKKISKWVLCVSDCWQRSNAALEISDIWKTPSLCVCLVTAAVTSDWMRYSSSPGIYSLFKSSIPRSLFLSWQCPVLKSAFFK